VFTALRRARALIDETLSIRVTMKSRVEVYRNLDYRDDVVYSVRTTHDRLVCKYVHGIIMQEVEFAVGPKGNQRVRDEKRKNVHAVVRGDWLTWTKQPPLSLTPMISPKKMLKDMKTMANWPEYADWVYERITYDPYKYKSFVTIDDTKPIYNSPRCFVGHECWALVPPK
jgi:hypothetical protein